MTGAQRLQRPTHPCITSTARTDVLTASSSAPSSFPSACSSSQAVSSHSERAATRARPDIELACVRSSVPASRPSPPHGREHPCALLGPPASPPDGRSTVPRPHERLLEGRLPLAGLGHPDLHVRPSVCSLLVGLRDCRKGPFQHSIVERSSGVATVFDGHADLESCRRAAHLVDTLRRSWLSSS